LRYLIGIDDTDNIESRGTGFHARFLGMQIDCHVVGKLTGISRHQLLVAQGIPYTTHNSCACMEIDWNGATESLINLCRGYLLDEAAPGSDAGLCVAPASNVSEAVQDFGERVTREIVQMADALTLAACEGFVLEGLTGTRCGVIGALAAVGLRATGNDGRFIWLPGTRELRGEYRASALCVETGIDVIATVEGTEVPPEATVDVGDWIRPVLRRGRAVLLVEPACNPADGYWRGASRDVVKACSGQTVRTP
jgi:hypothetical protein